jgi:hypothetical protein
MKISETISKLEAIKDTYGDLVVGSLLYDLDGDRVWSSTIEPCVVTYPKKFIVEAPITSDECIVIFD